MFAAGLFVAWQQGDVGLAGRRARWLGTLVVGLLGFAALQAWLQYAPMSEAPAIAYTGAPLVEGARGTPLDYAVVALYFAAILAVGTWFGRGQKTTEEFFFGGRRFSWWIIAFSLIATLIGSYSFVKYSRVGFGHGLSSTQTYLNDWFWLPLLVFGWLPLAYLGRITSVPEYFSRRFGPTARHLVTALLLVYLVGYIGINLFTMGKALHALLGFDVFWSAAAVAAVSAVYVTAGGQTSVIMTDLFQGVMLLATGLLILVLASAELGGLSSLWEHLPRDHRRAFSAFGADPGFPAGGIFWQDAMANTAMFYFLNQGILMRLLSARSLDDGRKAVVAVLVVLMPVAAVVVASGGWAGAAFVHAGVLPATLQGEEAFFVVAEMLSVPGVFGLVLAALTAALMSTVDTLVTAVAAVFVNDVVRPLRPEASDPELLRAARVSSVAVTVLGVALVSVFAQFDSIYAAHGAFTAAITPPMVVALLLGVFWRRATSAAAVATLAGGALAVFASILWPELVTPFAFGVDGGEPGAGWLGGMKQHKFMRAAYGLAVSAALGIGVSLVTRPRPLDAIRGMVWGTAPVSRPASEFRDAALRAGDPVPPGVDGLAVVRLSASLAAALQAGPGSRVYLTDRRWWLGGLRARQAVVGEVVDGAEAWVEAGPAVVAMVQRGQHPIRVQRVG